jgi:hypothetical protein
MINNRDRKSFESRRINSKVTQTTGTVNVFDPRSGISGPTERRAICTTNTIQYNYNKNIIVSSDHTALNIYRAAQIVGFCCQIL